MATASHIILLNCFISYCVGSRIDLHLTPDYVVGGVTQQLTLRCSLVDTAAVTFTNGAAPAKRDVTETADNIKYVTSILLTRNADDERVATIDSRSSATAEADLDSLTVNGDVTHSDVTAGPLLERAFLELRWVQPGYNQSGGYTCEINALDQQGHILVFKTSVEVALLSATQQDVVDETARLSSDDATTKARIAALESKFAQLEPAHVEQGEVSCGDSNNWFRNGNSKYIYKDVRFRKPYTSGRPVITVWSNILDTHSDHNLRLHIGVLSVGTNGFRIQCETWDDSHIYSMAVHWTSVVA